MTAAREPLVVDASVAVKWVVQEPGSAAARGLIAAGHALLCPSLMPVEAANAIGKRARSGELTARQAASAFQDLLIVPVRRFEIDDELVADSLKAASALRHAVQDCLYLALALRQGVRAITADRRFAAAIRTGGADRAQIVLLGEPLA